MNVIEMKKLDKYGWMFMAVHSLVFLNIAIDMWVVK